METNLTSIHEDVGLIPGFVSGSGIWCCRELRCRSQTWLRSHVGVAVHKAAAVAPIGPLSWELPYASGVALKSKKKKKKDAVPVLGTGPEMSNFHFLQHFLKPDAMLWGSPSTSPKARPTGRSCVWLTSQMGSQQKASNQLWTMWNCSIHY